MKTRGIFSKIASVAVVLGFGVFLLFGQLESSDFARGLFGPPNNAHWSNFDSLNLNQVWNYNFNGANSLQSYLDSVGAHGLKSVLRLDPALYDTFYLEYYSCAQHHIYEAEWDYGYSSENLPGAFYYFYHAPDESSPVRGELASNIPEGGASWKCSQAEDDEGVMLWGPNLATRGYGYEGNWGNQKRWPSDNDSSFKSIFRVMANLDQLNAVSDTVFHVQIRKSTPDELLAEAFYTGDSFQGTSLPDWKQFEIEYTIPSGGFYVYYKIKWMDNCDFWVDWIEFYDMDRGYYLFADDEIQDSILYEVIKPQCQDVENDHNDALAGWKQSDEPDRSAFDAHGVVNDMARDSLQFPPVTPFCQNWWSRRPELFALMGRPPILDTDIYVFTDTSEINTIGAQIELDTLAKFLEDAYQACGDSIPLHFTGQVHSWYKNGVWMLRDPMPSEIYAETYIALAHGATGISFFKYTSGPPYNPTQTDSGWGLVNTFDGSYSHPYGPPHYLGEKWAAVQNVFTQLDSIGDILLSLERDTAFCVYDEEPNPPFVSPITGVEFAEEDTNYIEVGQFHDANDTNYLILVNRRTDADRHINVTTNLSGSNALLDLYTREQFLSSTGEFKGIPFDSGTGRVFRIVEGFSD